MALIRCSECNREISDKATICPGCGAPVRQARPIHAGSILTAPIMGPKGLMVVLGVLAIPFAAVVLPAISATSKLEATGRPLSTTDETAAVVEPTSDEVEARDVVAVLRAWWPSYCHLHQAKDVAACMDDVVGYDKLIVCEAPGATNAQSVLKSLPAHTAKFDCGKMIEAALEKHVRMRAAYLQDVDFWLSAHKPTLSRCVSSKSLSDAYDDHACRGEPTEMDEKYEGAATPIQVNMLACTKRLFRCGSAADNVCWINKVADRVGAACTNLGERNETDGLFVRATGTRL